MVPIVQLAERLTVDQEVVGSRPTGHPEIQRTPLSWAAMRRCFSLSDDARIIKILSNRAAIVCPI